MGSLTTWHQECGRKFYAGCPLTVAFPPQSPTSRTTLISNGKRRELKILSRRAFIKFCTVQNFKEEETLLFRWVRPDGTPDLKFKAIACYLVKTF